MANARAKPTWWIKTVGSNAGKMAGTTPGPFIASKESNKYHYPRCSYVNQIKPENKITFKAAEAAIAAGYTQ